MGLIALKSDFRDYYDHYFAASWQRPEKVFTRMSRGGLCRSEMFQFLQSAGLKVPPYGRVKDLIPRLQSEYFPDQPSLACAIGDIACVVIYHDQRAHAGDGKELATWNFALKNFPNAFASEYIPATLSGQGVSLRYLRIGLRQFWLQYSSADDWRSNCGEVTVQVLDEEQRKKQQDLKGLFADVPLFAIDFIVVRSDLFALDYNIAPGLSGTGIEEIMTAQNVHEEISNVICSGNG